MERNHSIDTLKFICAVLVVLLHTTCDIQDTFLPLTRCAVPCFFMTSGYLLMNDGQIGKERLGRNLRHLLKVTVWATLLFAVIEELWALKDGGMYVPSLKQWMMFLFLNQTPFGFHLWYLYAYMYVLLIVSVADKHAGWKPLFSLIPILLTANSAFGNYSLTLWGRPFPNTLVRSFLFTGLPYFALGVWLKTRQDRLHNINRSLLLSGVIIFSLTSILEQCLDQVPVREHYISTTFLAMSLFLLMLSYNQKRATVISRLGERDSLYIYIFHPLFYLYLFPAINSLLPDRWNDIYVYISPLLTLVATTAFTSFLRKYIVLTK